MYYVSQMIMLIVMLQKEIEEIWGIWIEEKEDIWEI